MVGRVSRIQKYNQRIDIADKTARTPVRSKKKNQVENDIVSSASEWLWVLGSVPLQRSSHHTDKFGEIFVQLYSS